MEQRYTMPEAANMLGVSVSLLRTWVRNAGLREQVQKQRLDYDLRVFYLTQTQLEQVATLHGRRISPSPSMDIEAVDTALKEQIDDLKADLDAIKQRLARIEQQLGHQFTPPGHPSASTTSLEGKDD